MADPIPSFEEVKRFLRKRKDGLDKYIDRIPDKDDYLFTVPISEEMSSQLVFGGVALHLAKNGIAFSRHFDELELKRYSKLRESYHPYFMGGCEGLARAFRAKAGRQMQRGEGENAALLSKSADMLERASNLWSSDYDEAIELVLDALDGLSPIAPELGDSWRLVGATKTILHPSERFTSSREFSDILVEASKMNRIPTPVCTFLKLVAKNATITSDISKRRDIKPGAWFDMTVEERRDIQNQYLTAYKEYSDLLYGLRKDASPEATEKRDVVSNTFRKIEIDLVAKAGVNTTIIQSDVDAQPLAEILETEKRKKAVGPFEFTVEKITKLIYSLTEGKYPSISKSRAREAVSLLQKTRSIPTFVTVAQNLARRGVLPKYIVEEAEKILGEVESNRAIMLGRELKPIEWKPIAEDAFVEKHDLYSVSFPYDMPTKEREKTLGRVSAAVSDLEKVFGKGFCGKTRPKLRFEFVDNHAGSGKASYFAWDDRRYWQPRVKFGKDYEGVLAHELAHYFDDYMSLEGDRARRKETGEPIPSYGDIGGGLFTHSITVHRWLEVSSEYYGKIYPELVELMQAINDTPDYERWGGIMGEDVFQAIETAIYEKTGKLWLDHPEFKTIRDEDTKFRFLSDFPDDIVEAALKIVKDAGNGRRLQYYQSCVEVWARMCEQYVDDALGKQGISNPWLTFLSYDTEKLPQYMEWSTFESQIRPIMDRLFQRLKGMDMIEAMAHITSLFRQPL